MTGHPPHQRGDATSSHPAAGSEFTQRQLAAIARAASGVADAGSLSVTLNVLAEAVRSAAAVSAAQVVTLDPDGQLTVAGMAGFAAGTEHFTARLAECRARGADLVMLRVLRTGRPAVLPGRRAGVLADPRWEPIHALLASTEWDSFACVPMTVRDRRVGVLTAFYPPGADPGPAGMDFLAAMADQAALAVDYAALLATSREEARRRERERIARELHDCVVQQVFSMRLHAHALRGYSSSLAESQPLDRTRVRATAEELSDLATTTLSDLRELIFGLRPAPVADHGLVEAIRGHARTVQSSTGLHVRVEHPQESVDLDPALEDDLFRIVQEALHNVVKHARASTVRIRVDTGRRDRIVLDIQDDGQGLTAAPSGRRHLGLTSMTERAQRWGGTTQVSRGPGGGGTRVLATIPRTTRAPLSPSASPVPVPVPSTPSPVLSAPEPPAPAILVGVPTSGDAA